MSPRSEASREPRRKKLLAPSYWPLARNPKNLLTAKDTKGRKGRPLSHTQLGGKSLNAKKHFVSTLIALKWPSLK
jgi:hypothetical protein